MLSTRLVPRAAESARSGQAVHEDAFVVLLKVPGEQATQFPPDL